MQLEQLITSRLL